jgi:MFS family permease
MDAPPPQVPTDDVRRATSFEIDGTQRPLVPRAQRFAIYTLLSGEHLVNYLTRFSVPYIVPFLCQQYGFSELERARLLNAFQPGYVLTQIPGSWLAEKLGPRNVLGLNNAVMAAVLLSIPVAGRLGGAWAVWGCLFSLGLVQGPFIIGQAVLNNSVMPPSPSPERPLSQMIIRIGNNMAKLVAAALTPWLCGKVGWRSVPLSYGACIAGYCAVWMATTAKVLRGGNHGAGGSATAPEFEQHGAGPPQPGQKTQKKPPFTLRLLFCKPVQASLWNQVGHDCMEMQVLGAWAPTYYHEVLGVPLHAVGKCVPSTPPSQRSTCTTQCSQRTTCTTQCYDCPPIDTDTVWPMMVGFFAKLALGGMESFLLTKGVAQLAIRKMSNTIAASVRATTRSRENHAAHPS